MKPYGSGKPRKKVFEEKKRTHPLTSTEIPDFDLLFYLNRGGLPAVYPSDDYMERRNHLINQDFNAF
jgi:hypothetical protein